MTLAFIFIKPDFNVPQTKRFEVDDPLTLPPKTKEILPLSSSIGTSRLGGDVSNFGGFESGIGSVKIGGSYGGFSEYSSNIGVSSI